MAEARAAAMVGICAAVLIAAEPASADPAGFRRVVLHLDRQVNIPPEVLKEAQNTVAAVYRRIGVSLTWADGFTGLTAVDGGEHLAVVVVKNEPAGGQDPGELGKASREARRAYIFYARIVTHAFETSSDLTIVLAMVLAHEAGHLLLPDHSHTPTGLMRATYMGRIAAVPDFAPHQAALVRTRLAN